MGFDIDEPDGLTMSWRLSKLATRVSRTTPPGNPWFTGIRLLVLAVGGPRLDNAILVYGALGRIEGHVQVCLNSSRSAHW